MKELENNKAFDSRELEDLMKTGKATLDKAKTVSSDIEKSIKTISGELSKIPSAAKEGGVESAVQSLQSSISKGNYTAEKTRLVNAVSRLNSAVPAFDKSSAGLLKMLSGTCERLSARITDLERFVQKGTTDLAPEEFLKQLKEYKKEWEKEGKELEALLAAVKAGLKGMELISCMYSSDPVNLSTGNFIYDKTDIRIRGEAGISFRRFYNALEEKSGALGKGWTHNYALSLNREEDSVVLRLEDGKEETFEKKENGSFASVRGSLGILTETEDGYLYERADKRRDVFDRDGRCVRCFDVSENRTELLYDEAGRLIRVTAEGKKTEKEEGAYLTYAYNEEGYLLGVEDHAGRKVLFSYEEGFLVEVKAPGRTVYRYRYDRNGRMSEVFNTAGTVTVKNIYDEEGRTKRQIFPDGSRMKYRYLDEEEQVELTERNGSVIQYFHDSLYRNIKTVYEDGEERFTYDRNNRRTSHTDQNGSRTVYGYDNYGHLAKVVDAMGNRTSMTYNGEGKLLKVSVNGTEKIKNRYDSKGNLTASTDAEGNVTEMLYDDRNRLTCIMQPDGSRMEMEYDEAGNIRILKDAAGNKTEYRYDNLNRVTETTDGNGNTTRYAYNEKDEITEVVNAEGNTRHYAYNHAGKTVRMEDFDGSVTESTYNCLNRLETERNAEGGTVLYAYDSMWNVSKVTDAEGNETVYRYNGRNRLESMTDAEGNTTEYTYDACGNRTGVKDACGRETGIYYDVVNRPVRVEEPDGTETRYTYDTEGNLTEITDSLGNFWRAEYNGRGQKVSEEDSYGYGMHYEYDAMGNTVCTYDAAGRKTEYVYEKGRRPVKTVYPDGMYETYEYDGCGNLTKRERADGYAVRYHYDCMNRMIKMESSEGQTKEFSYDAAGNVVSVTDAEGNKTLYRYDRMGNLNSVTDAEGGISSYRYNRNGFLMEVDQEGTKADGEHRRVIYERDRLGRLTGTEDVFGRKETFTYDAAGRMTSKTDRDGFVTEYSYNDRNQPVQVAYGDGSTVRFTYDALRRLSEVESCLGTMTFCHDGKGNLSSVTDEQGKQVQYRYGVFGERKAVVYPDGTEISYEYDCLMRLKRLTGAGHTVEYAYDIYGRPSKKTDSEGIITEYGYDRTGLLSELVHRKDGNILESYRYGYDMAGNRTREERFRKGMEEESGIFTYAYDSLYRLTEVAKDGMTLRDYRYDGFGNRVEKTEQGKSIRYTYNALNQLIMDAGEGMEHGYEYDNRGNLIRMTENGALKHRYEFGALNRLTRAEDALGKTAEYGYNGLGHRSIIREGRENAWEKETSYVLDLTKSYHNLLQKEENGNVQSYIRDSEVLFMEENGESSRYLNDIQGSVMQLLDGNGNRAISYSYDEFGRDLSGNQGTFQPFGYTGYQKDETAGLYYAQAREYDAWSGRFTGEDIIKGNTVYPKTLNAYGYCWGNPLNYVDGDGRWPEWIDVSEDGAKKKIVENKENIIEAAEEAGVDPALVAIVIYTEQANNVNWRDSLTDGIGGFYGLNTSVGIGQVTIDTAKELEEKGYMPKTNANEGGWDIPFAGFVHGTERMAREKKLEDDYTNIRYVAAYIALIQDTWKDAFPEIVNRPDIIWTLYNIGYLGKGINSNPQPGVLADFAQKNYDSMKCLLDE